MSTTTALRIGLADNGRAMTLEEYEDAEVEEGYRYELARGVLEVSNVPGESHGLIVCLFYNALAAYWQRHPNVIFRYGGGSEFQLRLPAMISERHPDIAVALRNTPKDDRGFSPPALAIEVVSEGAEARRRDYETKREEYLAFGLREYWIVDPADRRVTALIRDGDAWVECIFRDEQAASGLVLPGFAMPLADLWAIPEEEAEQGQAGV